jgi:hypothetical protein
MPIIAEVSNFYIQHASSNDIYNCSQEIWLIFYWNWISFNPFLHDKYDKVTLRFGIGKNDGDDMAFIIRL